MNQLFYNPFLRVNEHSIPKLIEASKPYIVIQRFVWPGVEAQKGFLLSAYEREFEALGHAQELAPKEGKYQNLNDENDRQKVIDLVKTVAGYSVFFNGTIDKRNEKRLEKAYGKNVHSYIKYIRMPKDEEYNVRIYVEYGRVKAEISSGGHSHTALFSKIIT
ncbi:hypothetical protein [Mucilaginibacter sp. SJ]|uniref:hypothetical protein n=1 Tax=Mucilaginibacter sp. SJ TaxID=3029053 RepID=UPI0023A95305|nr:hypothetical protein [Mucilaginibacter sp. SJ]WEA01705.1 hypothetical protein MusilaSJ_02065 [Mucilaginibacter sp. SJ]